MSQQPHNVKASIYDQLLAVKDVIEVEIFDFSERGIGLLVIGGSDEDISEAMSMHTYTWNVHWFVGDTEYKREFFTARWYRNYYTFQAKYKELLGDVEITVKPFQKEIRA